MGENGPMTTPVPPKRQRHLINPDNPQRMRNDHQLTKVQRKVMSALAVTTIVHLCAGLVIAALFIDEEDTVARVGLCVIAGAFGVMAVGIARAIHRRPPLSPWLVLGVLPAVVGVWLVLR